MFLFNIQFRKCKPGAKILFNYLRICKSSGKICFGSSLCFLFLYIFCSKHYFLPCNHSGYHARYL